MIVNLIRQRPDQDGYYFVKFPDNDNVHLVKVVTEVDGRRYLLPDICPFKGLKDKEELMCLVRAVKIYVETLPPSWWSEQMDFNFV